MQCNLTKDCKWHKIDYAAQVENYKNIDSKKGWSEEQKNAIKAIAEANSTGVVYDPVTNEAKSGFNGYNIDDAPDLTELNSLMALMKSNKKVIILDLQKKRLHQFLVWKDSKHIYKILKILLNH